MKTQAAPAIAMATIKDRAIVCMFGSDSLAFRVRDLCSIERGSQSALLAIIACAVPEPRPADTGRAVTADDVALSVLAHHVVDKQILRDDDVAFQAHHFGDVSDAARAVT